MQIVTRTLDLLRSPKLGGDERSYLVIKLNGLIHKSDRLALREMARQLLAGGFGVSAAIAAGIMGEPQGEGDEPPAEEVDGDKGQVGMEADGSSFANYASTLNSLLGALEPGSVGFDAELEPNEGGDAERAAAEPTPTERARPLIVVLDEFDQWADGDRQRFLYTLLDIVQGNRRKGGMAVIGLSSAVVSLDRSDRHHSADEALLRQNCLEKLEKRVRSRCQSRVHYLRPPGKTVGERQTLCRDVLTLDLDRLPASDEAAREFAGAWNEEVEKFVGRKETGAWLDRTWQLQSEAVAKMLDQLVRRS